MRLLRPLSRTLVALALLISFVAPALADDAGKEKASATPQDLDPVKATLTRVGQEAPSFVLEMLGGGEFDLAEQRGKVVLINFFATWCPPCIQEMPHLESEVWARFKQRDFAMISVGREHPNQDIAEFWKKHELSFAAAGDPKREVFAKYAEHTIPRNVVVGKDGTILFQSFGFERPDFDAMIEIIAGAVGEPQ